MQITQGHMLLSLRAVQDFLDANSATLSAVVQTSTRQKLDDAVTELSGHASDQSGNTLSAQGSTKKHRALRTVLIRDYMAPIARIAQIELPFTPEIEPLRMPKARANVEQLVAAARGMATAAAPHAQTFIAAGLPVDFIVQLNAVSAAMLGSRREREQSIGRVSGATSSLRTKLVSARQVVHALDALVRVALKDDSTLLATWNQVKRVQKTRGRAVAITASASHIAPALVPVTTSAPVAAAA